MVNAVKQTVLQEIAAGATPQQCADKYNIPSGTIRSWLSRAKSCNATPETQRNVKRNATQQKATNKPIIRIEDVDEELTEMQRLFCWYYIHNFNATQAAIRAGYSPNTAGVIGHENLIKPNIRKEIERLKKIRHESILITPDDIIERYMRIAFADMTDFASFGQREEVVGIGMDGKEIKANLNYLDFKDSNIVDGGLICEISKGRSGAKIKLEDRQKALDWLARFFEMNPMDKHRQRYDEECLKIEREKLALAKEKSGQSDDGETEDDGFVEALKGQVADVWKDE